MHIQFVGVPGSGKSTIVNSLLNTYPDKYVRGKKFYFSFTKMLLNNPFIAFRSVFLTLPILPLCIKILNKSCQLPGNKYIAIVGLFLNIGNFLLFRNKTKFQNKIVLWDELMYQRALSVFSYTTTNPKSSDLLRYINWVNTNFNTLPIFILCDLELNKERLYERGVPNRMKSLNSDIIDQVIVNQSMTLLEIKKLSEKLLVLNSANDIEFNIELIYSKTINLNVN